METQLARTKDDALRVKRLIELAEIQIWNDPRRALELSRQAIGRAEAGRDSKSLARACNLAARATFFYRDYPASVKYLERAASLALQSRDSAILYSTYGIYVTLYADQGKTELSADYCRRREVLSAAVRDSALLIEMLLGSGGGCQHIVSDKNLRNDRLHKARLLAERRADRNLLARVSLERAGLEYEFGDHAAALKECEHALLIYESLGYQRSMADALTSMGIITTARGLRRKALEYFDRALRIREGLADSYGLARTLENKGNTLTQLRQLDRAQECYERSLKRYEAIDHQTGRGRALMNLGLLHARAERPKQALECLEKGRRIFEALDDKANLTEVHIRLGEVYRSIGRPSRALEHYAAGSKISLEMGDRDGAAQCQYWTGITHLTAARYAEALDPLRRSLDLWTCDGKSDGIAMACSALGDAYLNMGEIHAETALQFYTQSAALHERIGSRQPNVAKLLYQIAAIHIRAGRRESALESLRRGEQICEEIGDIPVLANTLYSTASVLRGLHRQKESLAAAERSRKLYLEIRDSASAMQAGQFVAAAYLKMGVYDEALTSFQDVLRWHDRHPDASIVPVLLNLGVVLGELNRNEDALTHIQRSREMAVRFRDEGMLPKIEYNLAMARKKLKHYDDAVAGLRRCGEISARLGNHEGSCLALLGIGGIHAEQSHHEQALAVFTECLALAEKHGLGWEKREAHGNLGSIHLKYGEYADALGHYKTALALAETMGDASRQMDMLKLMGEANMRLGHYERAYDHLSRHAALRDSLLNENIANTVAALNAKYESERKDNEIALLARDKSFTALTLRQQKDRLALQELELKRREAVMAVQRLTAIRLRQQADLLMHEHELQELELAKRTAERDAEQAKNAAATARLRTATQEKLYQGSIAAREQARRNALLGGLGLTLVIGFLAIKRIQGKRIEASLRAEAAEYQAKVVEAQTLALSAEAERREKEAQQIFSRQLIEFQEQERKRLSSELHDSLSQDLIVIKNRAQMAMDADAENACAHLDEVIAMAASALTDVRQISRELRPYQIDQVGLAATIRGMLQRIEQASTVHFTIEFGEIDRLLKKDDEIKLYRLVQESVNNILKHAEATEATVRLRQSDGALRLSVTDNGKGFTPRTDGSGDTHGGGLGLKSMEERTQMLGGKMRIKSAPGKGTRIEITLPLNG